MSCRLQSLMLVAVIVSNLLIGAHVTAHYTADTVECELCAAYSDPPDAIPAIESSLPVTLQAANSPLCLTIFVQRASVVCPHPRGPPTLI